MELVVVTGLSGAGRRSVLGALEDSGFTALDNVPARLLEPLIELEDRLYPGRTRLAVGMDSRHEDFGREFEPMLRSFEDRSQPVHVIFVEADDEVLLRRFSETRRVHHLAGEGGSVSEAIRRERQLLAPIRARATAVLNTSRLTLSDMRQRIHDLLPGLPGRDTKVRLVSFGFKFGVPLEADVVLDARFLPNPHYVPELKPLNGRDEPVQKFLLASDDFKAFLAKTEDWLRWSLPLVQQEGRAYHTIAIGCTGGQHRSVALAEILGKRLKQDFPNLTVRHREQDVHPR
ncbi:MAG TPA: RNase adapter RapZ [Holophagaceae bacterium]|nr:RNase adapter RapZ [Holophagaceae bacterium]